MKKLIFVVFIILGVFFSCKKEEKELKNLCPIVMASDVPNAVKESFLKIYPSTTVSTWFYKDSSSYCALFSVGTIKKLAQFDIKGDFIRESVELDQEGEHQDSTGIGSKTSEGCECEIPDKEGE